VALSVIRRKPGEPMNSNGPDALLPARASLDTPPTVAAQP
jgi:hypothetical protein